MQQDGSCKAGTRVQGPLAVPNQRLTVTACTAFQILAWGVQGHLALRLQDYFSMVISVVGTVLLARIFPGPPPGPMTTCAREGIHQRNLPHLPLHLLSSPFRLYRTWTFHSDWYLSGTNEGTFDPIRSHLAQQVPQAEPAVSLCWIENRAGQGHEPGVRDREDDQHHGPLPGQSV